MYLSPKLLLKDNKWSNIQRKPFDSCDDSTYEDGL